MASPPVLPKAGPTQYPHTAHQARRRVRLDATLIPDGVRFAGRSDYEAWIESQQWYQTMTLPSGVRTKGSVRTDRRLQRLRELDWSGRSVLDIGCNSGQYCFFAKEHGASRVVGIDINKHRLQQARTLGLNEGLSAEFYDMSLFDAPTLGRFDIVLCFAVLTEVQDLFGGLHALSEVVGSEAHMEIGLAARWSIPVSPRSWKRRVPGVPPWRAAADVRVNKRGTWTILPTFDVLSAAVGTTLVAKKRRGGLRYNAIELRRCL